MHVSAKNGDVKGKIVNDSLVANPNGEENELSENGPVIPAIFLAAFPTDHK